MRRNIGHAYGGRACWTSFRKELQLKFPVESAMAAIPAFPSTPIHTHTHTHTHSIWGYLTYTYGIMGPVNFRTKVALSISPGTFTPNTATSVCLNRLLSVPSTSVVDTFSPFQRNVSPLRSRKYMYPSSSITKTSPKRHHTNKISLLRSETANFTS